MIKDKYLPVGSVVLLKGGNKKLMIIGFAGLAPETEGKIYDYIGCFYPEGIVSSDKNILFNHSQIAELCFEGYATQEDLEYKEKLNSIVKAGLANGAIKESEESIELPISLQAEIEKLDILQ